MSLEQIRNARSRMPAWAATVLIGAIATGCKDRHATGMEVTKPIYAVSPQTVISEFGFQTTVLGRDVLSEAMKIANNLAQDQVILRVVPAWTQMDVAFDPEEPPVLVPVIVVSSTTLPPQSLAFVPQGRSCIIVNGDGVQSLLDDLPTESISGSTKEALLPSLWAVILLHELGHIFFSDQIRTPMFATSEGELNLVRDANKIAELRCDHFAAMQVRISVEPGSRGDWMTGLAPPIEHEAATHYLANPLQKQDRPKRLLNASQTSLSVGLVAYDYWDQISDGTSPAPPSLFWDRGYTHPNLRLRFLYMASLIEPGSRLYREFLEQMLAIRNQRAYEVLYRAEYTGIPGPEDWKNSGKATFPNGKEP